MIGLRILPHDSADVCGIGTRDEPPKDICVGGLRPPGCIKVERVELRWTILKFNIYLTKNWRSGGIYKKNPLRLESQVVS